MNTETLTAVEKITNDVNAKIANLPALTGSEKQIAWATDIRQEYAESFAEYYEGIAPYYHPAAIENMMHNNAPLLLKVLDVSDAAFWINKMRRQVAGQSIEIAAAQAEQWIATH